MTFAPRVIVNTSPAIDKTCRAKVIAGDVLTITRDAGATGRNVLKKLNSLS
jgi:hypothetical protein